MYYKHHAGHAILILTLSLLFGNCMFASSSPKNHVSKLSKLNPYSIKHVTNLQGMPIYSILHKLRKANKKAVKSYQKKRRIFKNTRKRRATPLPSHMPNGQLEYGRNICRLYAFRDAPSDRLVYDCHFNRHRNSMGSENITGENLLGLNETLGVAIDFSPKQSVMFSVLSDVVQQWRAPDVVTELRMRRLNIGMIESGAFGRVKNRLRKLDLAENSIAYISRAAFNGLRNLEELNLSQNRIQFLPRGLFYGMLRLSALDLAHNELETIHPRSFKDIKNMVYLNVSFNLLDDLSAELFRSITSERLSLLDISHNNLTKPKSEWLNSQNRKNSCTNVTFPPTKKDVRIHSNTTDNSTVLVRTAHILNASANPWDCNCEDALKFTETVIQISPDYESRGQCDRPWEVDLSCSLSNDSVVLNLGIPEEAATVLFRRCCVVKSNWSQPCSFIKGWLARNKKESGISNEQVTIIGIVIVICIPVLLTASPDCNRSTANMDNPNVKFAAAKSAELAYGVVSRVTHTGILSTDRYFSELRKEPPDRTKTIIIPGKRYYDNYSDSE